VFILENFLLQYNVKFTKFFILLAFPLAALCFLLGYAELLFSVKVVRSETS